MLCTMVLCNYNKLHSALGFEEFILLRENIVFSTLYHTTTNEVSLLIVCMISKLPVILQVIRNLKQKVILNLKMVQVIRHFLESRMRGLEKVITYFHN
jgi:hypothetical protein